MSIGAPLTLSHSGGYFYQGPLLVSCFRWPEDSYDQAKRIVLI